MALDVGPRTLEQFERLLGPREDRSSGTARWASSRSRPFDAGTMARGAHASPRARRVTVVGGGESVQAAHAAGVAEKFTHVSTGGGASLGFLAEGKLPGIEALGD